MSNIHPHDLHQAIRSWLLAEDPYGMNQRQEPTFPDMRAPAVGQAAVANAIATPPPDPRGATAGPAAVQKQLFGGGGARYSEAERDPRGQAQGEAAVERATGPDVGSEAFQGSRNPRAQFRGAEAVRNELAPELAPPPTTEMQRLQMAGALGDAQGKLAAAGGFPPSAPSGEEIRGRAKKRLKDPVDEDDKSPE